MPRLLKSDSDPALAPDFRLDSIRADLARAMIGRTVQVLAGAGRLSQHITHGIVTAVFNDAGHPKILVGGRRYELDQVLTIVPAGFN